MGKDTGMKATLVVEQIDEDTGDPLLDVNSDPLPPASIVGNIFRIKPGNYKRGKLECSDLATEDFEELLPEDLATIDEMEIGFWWDSSAELPLITGRVRETILTWPLQADQDTAADITGTAFITELEFPEFVKNTVQQGMIKIQFDGVEGPVYTKAVLTA